MNNPENTFTTLQKKICLLGEFAVGKTSLVRRYIEGRFDDRYLSTIGVKISRRTVQLPRTKINLLLWDLAGSDEFNGQIRANYLRGASGAIIVCDLTRRETLAGFSRYLHQVYSVSPNIPLLFAGNKADLLEERQIALEEVQDAAQAAGVDFFITSAKNGENVEAMFLRLAEQVTK